MLKMAYNKINQDVFATSDNRQARMCRERQRLLNKTAQRWGGGAGKVNRLRAKASFQSAPDRIYFK